MNGFEQSIDCNDGQFNAELFNLMLSMSGNNQRVLIIAFYNELKFDAPHKYQYTFNPDSDRPLNGIYTQ